MLNNGYTLGFCSWLGITRRRVKFGAEAAAMVVISLASYATINLFAANPTLLNFNLRAMNVRFSQAWRDFSSKNSIEIAFLLIEATALSVAAILVS